MQDSSAAGNAPADPADDRVGLDAGPDAASRADAGVERGGELGAAPDADPADAARRLGAALERIARLAPRARGGDESDGGLAPDPAAAEVAARLDQIIAQLRGVIAGLDAGGTQA